MMRPQPLVVVADVEAASQWFQHVLGLTSGHGGPNYEMLLDGGKIATQLHQWEADEHPHLGDPSDPSRGNGVLLWFSTDDFDTAVARVRDHDVTILDGPLLNPNSRQREVWVRGPEGYVVVVSGPREAP
jgi:catechol 2,3-dioxygenase-like lactoylglutathione lyase family enzyme